MHFFPYHKKAGWQKILLGIFIGGILAYILFTYMYGKMYEDILTKNIQLQTEVATLKKRNEALTNQKEALEENEVYTIQETTIHFTNEKPFAGDELIKHQLRTMIQKELESFIGKSVQSLAENDSLLIKLIENNVYTIDDVTFELEVKKLFIYDNLTFYIHLKKGN